MSLDILELYRGEDMICQNPEDVDPDQWLDKGEPKELPEIPTEEAEVRVKEQSEDLGGPELYPEPNLVLTWMDTFK